MTGGNDIDNSVHRSCSVLYVAKKRSKSKLHGG